MSNTFTVPQGSSVPPYAQVNKKCKHKITPATYDDITRDGAEVRISQMASIDNVMYSSMLTEDHGRSSMYSHLQRDNRPKEPSKAVPPAAKSGGINTKRCVFLVIFTTACFAILLICLVGVIVGMNSEISKLKCQYRTLQPRVQKMEEMLIQESSSDQRSTEMILAISSLHGNISRLQDHIVAMEDNLNAVNVNLNSTWGLSHSLVEDLFQANGNFGHVIETLAKLGTSESYPASSCNNILLLKPESPSGMYWLRAVNGTSVSAFCHMGSCNGVGTSWVRIVKVNATSACPSNFEKTSEYGGACILKHEGCTSLIIPMSNVSYSKVCGSVSGFGIDTPDGFDSNNDVDGIKITSNGQHVWTFASRHRHSCDCAANKPDFVADNYSCMRVFSSSHRNVCDCAGCSPEFITTLPETTSEDIKVAVCTDQSHDNEQMAFTHIELYIQ